MVRNVKAMHPNLPVIFMSGYAEEAFRKNDQSSEDIHFLPKPFGLKQLAAKVKWWNRSHRLEPKHGV